MPNEETYCFSVSEITAPPEEVRRFFTPKHSERGTRVHRMCSEYLDVLSNLKDVAYCKSRNRSFDEPKEDADTSYEAWALHADEFESRGFEPGYITSLSNLKDMGFECLIGEKRLYSDTGLLCGKVDFVGTIKARDGLGLIDFKTSEQTYKSWRIQLGGYLVLLNEYNIFPEWAATARIRKKGTNPLINFYIKNQKEVIEAKLKFIELMRKFILKEKPSLVDKFDDVLGTDRFDKHLNGDYPWSTE